jgi:tRNA(Ile)-lysidine synthase
MDRLGPFEPAPHLAVAVSGGADSLSLAVLAADWAHARGGRTTGLIVDHGLRAESAGEAREAAATLAARGVAPVVLTVAGLSRGPGLAARAREARYGLLTRFCGGRGILHLLIGHHRADQAETLLLRRAAGSGAAGLAGMAALAETADMRLLRPLLDIPPGRLRATLRARGLGWSEDPSNADPSTPRARLRAMAGDPDGTGAEVAALFDETLRRGDARAASELAAARWLARHAEIRPEGFALLDAGPWDAAALAGLVRMLAGADHAPSPGRIARLAAAPRACTLGGVRVMDAGRWRPGGWLLAREAAAMSRPVVAASGAVWDGRFRMTGAAPPGATLGALGDAAAAWRGALPTAVLRTMPMPAEGRKPGRSGPWPMPGTILFAPPRPAACSPFAPGQPGC